MKNLIWLVSSVLALNACSHLGPKPQDVSEIPQLREPASDPAVATSVKADWNKDDLVDSAALTMTDPESPYLTATISFGQNDGSQKVFTTNSRLIGNYRPEILSRGSSISLNEKGSLVLSDFNDGGGRSRWKRTYVFVYQNDRFILAGLSIEEHDQFDRQAGGACELNFLTGKGTRNLQPFTFTAATPEFSEVTSEFAPKECIFPAPRINPDQK